MVQQEVVEQLGEFEAFFRRGFEEDILELSYTEPQSQESKKILKESGSVEILKQAGTSLIPSFPDVAVYEGSYASGVRYAWMRWNVIEEAEFHYMFNEVVIYALSDSQEIAIALEGGCLVLPQELWKDPGYFDHAVQYAKERPKHTDSYYARPHCIGRLQPE